MKKLLLSLVILIAFASLSLAQKQVTFGVRAGSAVSHFVVSDTEGNSASGGSISSFYLGGVADIALNKLFSVQPSLLFIGKGTRNDMSFSLNDVGYNYTLKNNTKISPYYLEMPVNLIASFNVGSGKIFAGAGPYYAIGLTGRFKSDQAITQDDVNQSISVDESIKFGSGNGSHLKKGDFGFNALAGYELRIGLDFHVGYDAGLQNITNESGSKLKNRTIRVGIGWDF